MKIKARFVEKKTEVLNVNTFTFKPLEPFVYKAGQYAVFDLGKDGKPFAKPFSFIDAPGGENIRITTRMSGSNYKNALDALKPGDEVGLNGPLGTFCLENETKNKLCFLAGGIGITPVKSMIEGLTGSETQPEITLFYSNKTKDGITFKTEIDALTGKLNKFNVVYALTEEKDAQPPSGTFETGYITADMIKKYRADYAECRFYVSGPPSFNTAMKKMLTETLNLADENIVMEAFAGY